MPKTSDLFPQHFTRLRDEDGKSRKATCNYCKDGKEYKTENGTTNLRRHFRRKHPKEAAAADQKEGAAVQQQPPCPPSGSSASVDRDPRLDQDEAMQDMEEAPSGSSASVDRDPRLDQDEAMQDMEEAANAEGCGLQEEARKHLARMIAWRGYDASVLEDDCFKSFVRSINPEFEVPSRVAIEHMCEGIFDEARRGRLDRLRRAPGKVNVAVGTAKTMDVEVVYVACQFIDEGWNLHKMLLHVIVAAGYHKEDNGPILGLDSGFTFKINKRVVQIVSGHGIYDRLFMVSSPAGCSWSQVRKKIIVTEYVDNVLHSIALCLLPDQDFTQQVFRGMKDLRFNRQQCLELLAGVDQHYKWEYKEHWYACYCCLKILCKKDFPGQLGDKELVVAKLLCKLWGEIYRAIQKISSSTCPTGNLCLVELFKLWNILQRELEQFSSGDHGDFYDVFWKRKNVMDVLRKASDSLYEAINGSYLTWSLPLALDPRYKLKYVTFNLEKVYGLEAAKEYVSKVTTMIMELYADYVKEYGTANDAHHSDSASAMDTTTSGDDPLQKEWIEHCRSQQDMTTQVTRSSYPEAETELDRYIRDPLAPHPQAEGFDILSWWKAHSSEYPMVARMARDALSMPTCSKLSSDQMAQLRSMLRGFYCILPLSQNNCTSRFLKSRTL